jgi:hypothetical protein
MKSNLIIKLRRLFGLVDIDWITKNLAISSKNDNLNVLDADIIIDVSDLSDKELMEPTKMDKMVEIIADQIFSGNRIILMSNDGRQRSPLIVISYLIKYGNVTISGSASKIMSKRSINLEQKHVDSLINYRDYLYSKIDIIDKGNLEYCR